ncbi:hypothetical protein [Bifidobacterium sp. SO1]|uniref:hypothetical protein n=1 Tax=Bifidobacterium sp. SO1 TaxID=2809029 RepID=UPI001BDBD43A|nr:hypothetical protein [Bifidobacterium sp. SO1]MBT1162807.1 hypothetical protein [Bifidobacterium sp. SO1]
MNEYMRTLTRKTIRLSGTDPYAAEDAYYYLIRACDENEHRACRLLIEAVLSKMGEHWPDRAIDRLEEFAYRCCADKGIEPVETIMDTVTFAVDMHDWKRIAEDES